MSDPLIDVPKSDPEADLSIDTIEALLREHYGLTGQVFPVEGRHAADFLVDNGHMRYLLKVAPATVAADGIETEHALIRHIIRSPDGPGVPEPVATKDGTETIVLPLGDSEKRVRLLTFRPGDTLPYDEKLSALAVAAFGALAASLDKSLADFPHSLPDLEPEVEPGNDLRKAGPQTVSLLSVVADQERRDMIAKVMVAMLRRIQPLGPNLRTATVHQNLNGDAVVGDLLDGVWQPNAITDFTAVATGWVVAGLANTCAFLLDNQQGDVFAVLPAIRAYHEINPLLPAELEALWPLVVARTGILAARAENRHSHVPEDSQAAAEAKRRLDLLEKATAISPATMFCAILDATGQDVPVTRIGRLIPELDPERIRIVDLGIASPILHSGNWIDPENDWKSLAHIAWETGCGATRWGEYRLSKTATDPRHMLENFALHIDACMPAGAAAVAPFAGVLKSAGTRLVLAGPDITLHVEGLECELPEGTELAAGAPFGVVAGEENAVGGLRLRLCRDPEMTPPLFSAPQSAGLWSRLCPSPACLLGIEAEAPLASPIGKPIRGWKEHVFDSRGRCGLDFSGAAPLVGYGHPRLAMAIYRQSLLLDNEPGRGLAAGPSASEQLLVERLSEDQWKDFSPVSNLALPAGASAVAIARALAILDVIEDEKLMENAQEVGTYMRERLDELAGRSRHVVGVSGNGLELDLELADDAGDLRSRLGPTILVGAGPANRLALRPPLCLSRESVDWLIVELERALDEDQPSPV